MLNLGPFLILSVLSLTSSEASLNSTALKFLLQENKNADFAAPNVKKYIQQIRSEIDFITRAVVISEQKKIFFGFPPFSLGKVILRFKKDLNDEMEKKVNENNLEIKLIEIENALFQKLSEKFQFSRMQKMPLIPIYTIEFPEEINPIVVADALKESGLVDVATENHIFTSVASSYVERFSSRGPTIYRLTFGWGDCSVTCEFAHRFYFEAGKFDDKTQRYENPVSVGQSGDAIPEEFKKNFKLLK
jgi:hypothetical protein